jgi:hypothetical protein
MTPTHPLADRAFRRKQGLVVALSLAAALVVAAVGASATTWFAALVPAADDPATRLAFAARCLVAPGLALLAGIANVGRRGFYADAIDGTRTPANHGLEIGLRYNLNTLEQCVLVLVAWPALAVTVAHAQLAFLPALAGLFVAGRVAFWVGYLLHPTARAFGMTMTVLPTAIAYGWLVARWLA